MTPTKNDFPMMEAAAGSRLGNAGIWEKIFNALADLPEACEDQVSILRSFRYILILARSPFAGKVAFTLVHFTQ